MITGIKRKVSKKWSRNPIDRSYQKESEQQQRRNLLDKTYQKETVPKTEEKSDR
ncbi:hypothetical protein OEV98_15035 [Caldibacillus lycopersici]|uniref:Uncharacterized protein n=1 Tax=Perspicuibacillus lycopersici TaxID=1325689 RepID=A0AAE3IUU1_9BACI|nr:hypothetical protein [Perspicuibacillus lycopersici]MCU9614857.1 hypothetical protein [Perspicuibacillus lycopersici]